MELIQLHEFSTVKQGDTSKKFMLQAIDSDGYAINLSNYPTRKIVIGNSLGKILEITPTLESESGVFSFSFQPSDVTGYGNLLLELHLTNQSGTLNILPEHGYFEFVVEKSVDTADGRVSSYTLTYFKDEMNKNQTEIKSIANTAALNAAAAEGVARDAVEKAEFVQKQFDQVTGDGTIDPAVEQMKVDLEGVSHPSPDARLRSELQKRDELLAETEQELEEKASKKEVKTFITLEDFGGVADCEFFDGSDWYTDSSMTELATDNTNALKDAIAYIANYPTSVNPDRKIKLLGKYCIRSVEKINMFSRSISIEGVGSGVSGLFFTKENSGLDITGDFGNGYSYELFLEKMTLNGSNICKTLIYGDKLEQFYWDDVILQHAADYAAHLKNVSLFTFKRPTLQDNAKGILLENAGFVNFRDANFWNSTYETIAVKGNCSNINFNNCWWEYFGVGINILPGANFNLMNINNCHFLDARGIDTPYIIWENGGDTQPQYGKIKTTNTFIYLVATPYAVIVGTNRSVPANGQIYINFEDVFFAGSFTKIVTTSISAYGILYVTAEESFGVTETTMLNGIGLYDLKDSRKVWKDANGNVFS